MVYAISITVPSMGELVAHLQILFWVMLATAWLYRRFRRPVRPGRPRGQRGRRTAKAGRIAPGAAADVCVSGGFFPA